MSVLLLVDIQHDFLPGGALAVPYGDHILPVVEELILDADHVIASQDYHPSGHASFASTHGKEIGEKIDLDGVDQHLWPDHCVQGSHGAKLVIEKPDHIVQKGVDIQVDSYSAFFDNGRKRQTGLNGYLKKLGVKEIVIAGLALDYCVKFTALDAISLGYRVHLVRDGCKAVNINPDDEERSLVEMACKGVIIV